MSRIYFSRSVILLAFLLGILYFALQKIALKSNPLNQNEPSDRSAPAKVAKSGHNPLGQEIEPDKDVLKKVTPSPELPASVDWRTLGNGSDRYSLMWNEVNALTPSDFENWLQLNIEELGAYDAVLFLRLSEKFGEISANSLISLSNVTNVVEIRKLLLEGVFTGFTFNRVALDEVVSMTQKLSDTPEKSQLLKNVFEYSVTNTPLTALNSYESACKKHPHLAGGGYYNIITPTFEKVKRTDREAVWEALKGSPGTQDSIASRIFSGQYNRDSLEATEWLNTLPSDKRKASAVLILVATLSGEGDIDSATQWAASAESYLSASDKSNIKIHIEAAKKKRDSGE
jgi:hypothetical protein